MAIADATTTLISIGYAFLFSVILLGWAYWFAARLGANLSLGLYNATAFLGLSVFFAFLTGRGAQILTYGLLGFGLLFFIEFLLKTYVLCNDVRSVRIQETYKDPYALGKCTFFVISYFFLSIFCLITAYGLQFRSIDDYSFWGSISKYLFLFHGLPNNDQYIHANFLSYTPGMASFDYLIFSLSGRYSQFLGYFGQGLIFVSALLVLAGLQEDPRPPQQAVVNMSLLFILFFLAYGFVLGRMEVDATVAAFYFISSWIVYKKKENALGYIWIPLLFLSVIKEIGLLFSFFTVIYYFVSIKPKTIKDWAMGFGISLSLLAIKMLWKYHVIHRGFHGFSSGIHSTNALAALNPFNANYHQVQVLFLKAVLFANFDHLIKIPYIVIYLLISGIYYFLLKNYPDYKKNLQHFMRIFSLFAAIYLLMLYLLQAIVFQGGYQTNEILDFPRYYNMLFLPWFCMCIFITLDITEPKWLYQSKKSAVICLIIASIFFVGGKIERSMKFYPNDELNAIYNQISQKILMLQNKKNTRNLKICLLNPPYPYYRIGMPLRYFLMPNRVYYPVNKKNEKFCDLMVRWKRP